MTAPQHFTALQLATALGVSRGAAFQRLSGAVPNGSVIVRGKKVNAYTLATLPESILKDLRIRAKLCGHGDDVHRLFDPRPAPWQSPVPWHKIPRTFQEPATKLSQALAPALTKQHLVSSADTMEAARIAYRQTFGHEIGDDKLRYIMDRATRRDNGAMQFHRPELYLGDAAFSSASSPASTSAADHSPLDDYITSLENRQQPTLADRRSLLLNACTHFRELTAGVTSRGQIRAVKHSIVEYLYRAVPGLYTPRRGERNQPLRALRLLFNRWLDSGGDRPDNRANNKGRPGYRCDRCEALIRAKAVELRGPGDTTNTPEANESLALKLLLKEKPAVLCHACISRYENHRPTNAQRVRMTPNPFLINDHKGASASRKISPTHHCDWKGEEAGNYMVIDDMTCNELAYDEVDGQIISGQVQMLYTEDEFSTNPLPFYMYFGAPNSATIKKELRIVFTVCGVPHMALITEHGVFANRLLSGDRRAIHRTILFRALEHEMKKLFAVESFERTEAPLKLLRNRELGFRDPTFGLDIIQANSPQAKTVERSFHEIQKRASELPGFRGFNQRREASREMLDFDRRVKTGKEHPGNEYLHIDELRRRYESICEDYRNDPMGGRLRGRTPAQVWQEAIDRRPLRKLPPEIEHLLATQRIPEIKVQPSGIRVRLDRFEDAYYFDEHTGPLAGRKVAVYIDREFADFIHIEHPDTGKLLKVKRILTKRHGATPAEIAEVNSARRAHITGARGFAGNLTINRNHITNDADYRQADIETGRLLGEAKEQHRTAETQHRREVAAVRDLAESRGDDPEAITDPGRYKSEDAIEQQARARYLAKQKAAATQGTP